MGIYKTFLTVFYALSLTFQLSASDLVKAEIVSPVKTVGDEKSLQLGLLIDLPDGWKMYGFSSKNESGFPPSIIFHKKENIKDTDILWPKEEEFLFQGTKSYGYQKKVFIPFQLDIGSFAEDIYLEGKISYLICKDICVPKEDFFSIRVPKGKSEKTEYASLFDQKEEYTFLYIVLLAFMGGVILNFMPCVLPVLSLKLMSLSSGRSLKKSSFYTFLGILISFMILGLFAVFLKASGEAFQLGIQFQNPYFLIFMIIVMFFFTANLWGRFEVGQNFIYRIPAVSQESPIGDIWNGFIAVFLATPCTAPFLGGALSYALSQSYHEILGIFLVMALGFSLPYILFFLLPSAWIRLPKPGIWMKYLKTILGMGMYLTSLWLLWIFSDYIPYPCLLMVFPFLILFPYRFIFLITVISFIGFSIVSLYWESQKHKVDFLEEHQIVQLIDEKRPIILKVTAKWCVTCKILEKKLFSDQHVLSFDPIILSADWTRPNEKIRVYLQSKMRSGIPLFVIYGPKAKQGIVLSEYPNVEEVVNSFKKALGSP